MAYSYLGWEIEALRTVKMIMLEIVSQFVKVV